MAGARFHFDLSHVPAALPGLRFHAGAHACAIAEHTEQTRAQALRDNAALALIAPAHRHRITHYADVDESKLPRDTLCRLRVTYDHGDARFYLRGLVLLAFHIPERVRRRHRERRLAASNAAPLHAKLAHYGVAAVAADRYVEVARDADLFITPMDVAKSIVFHHPSLATRDAATAAVVMDDHIDSPANHAALANFATAIAKQGQAGPEKGWARIEPSTTADGTVLVYEYPFNDHPVGQPVLHYSLSDATEAALAVALRAPLNSASDDQQLQGRSWSVAHGEPARYQPGSGGAARARSARGRGAPTFKWVPNETQRYRLELDRNSIGFQDGRFWINVSNTGRRTFGAYAQFLDDNNTPISNPTGWTDQLPSGLSTFESGDTRFVMSIAPVNLILGIARPTDPFTVQFPWPKEATGVRLIFGSLGTSDWNGAASPMGTLLTGLFQYGLPLLFIAATAGIKSTKWYNAFVSNRQNVILAILALGPAVGTGIFQATTVFNTKRVLFTVGNLLAGILFAKGMELLAAKVMEDMTEDEIEDSVPFIGWAARAAQVWSTWGAIITVTEEVLSSPASIEFEVKRAFDLVLTLHPDPEHGEAGHPETAVWPAVGHHYVVTVQYKGGTSVVEHDDLPSVTSSDPLVVRFEDLPAGGRIQIFAGIYSRSGWLCGKWQSDWMDALPKDGDTLTLNASIEEQLVPLTADTQYVYKERIVFDAAKAKHVWNADGPPVATVADLDASNIGPAYAKPVNLTISQKAFEIGYAWQAAPQALPLDRAGPAFPGQAYLVQNLSVLADPERRFKVPNVAFSAQPYIAYDQFGPAPGASGPPPYHFVLDPRNGENHLRYVKLDDGSAMLDLLSPNLQSWGCFQIPHLDAIVIHPGGYAIGASWETHRLAILKIPSKPSKDADAPVATIMAGEGLRQGLLNGPMAITITPDGRLLVLETINQRVQAFDTAGNPVPSFDGPALFDTPAAPLTADLDAGRFPDALQAVFQQQGVTQLFTLPPALAKDLDGGAMTPALFDAFSDAGVMLSQGSDPADGTSIAVAQPGRRWTIRDAGRNRSYLATAASSGAAPAVYAVLSNVQVNARAKGLRWIVRDADSVRAWDLRVSETKAGMLTACDFLSTLPLRPTPGKTATYLDLATEAKGYIYVLSYVGDGSSTSDYLLDIYDPDGAFVCRTPDARVSSTPQNVAAARIAVDVWRNLYALNYEKMVGPGGRTEPSISHWFPSPPLFSLELASQPAFDSKDVAAVRAIFASHQVTLPAGAQVNVVSPNGYWTVTAPGKSYDVIRSGAALNVYLLASPGLV